MGAQKKKKIKCISHEVISRESSALNNKNYTDELSTVWERRRRYTIFRPEVTTRESSALNVKKLAPLRGSFRTDFTRDRLPELRTVFKKKDNCNLFHPFSGRNAHTIIYVCSILNERMKNLEPKDV